MLHAGRLEWNGCGESFTLHKTKLSKYMYIKFLVQKSYCIVLFCFVFFLFFFFMQRVIVYIEG